MIQLSTIIERFLIPLSFSSISKIKKLFTNEFSKMHQTQYLPNQVWNHPFPIIIIIIQKSSRIFTTCRTRHPHKASFKQASRLHQESTRSKQGSDLHRSYLDIPYRVTTTKSREGNRSVSKPCFIPGYINNPGRLEGGQFFHGQPVLVSSQADATEERETRTRP